MVTGTRVSHQEGTPGQIVLGRGAVVSTPAVAQNDLGAPHASVTASPHIAPSPVFAVTRH